jgi:hypothetical protein
MTSEDADRCGPPVATYRVPGLAGVHFEWRPISRVPPEKTAAFMYRREGDNYTQSGAGFFKGGGWVNGSGKPIEGDYLWAAMVDD